MSQPANTEREIHYSSLGVRLLRIVFSIYLVITLVITGVQMYNEYSLEKQAIIDNLIAYEDIFGQGLATALWNLDDDQLNATLTGLSRLGDIAGVQLHDPEGKVLYEGGRIFRSAPSPSPILHTLSQDENLFSHHFQVRYRDRHIGDATLISSNGIVFDKVKYNFLAIVLNAAIKTLVLWFLFLWAFRRFLVRALDQFVARMEHTHFDRPIDDDLDIDTFKTAELERLKRVFAALLCRITDARSKLDHINQSLEDKVQARTREFLRQQSMLEAMSFLGRIGAWEYDLASQRFYWSDMTRIIADLEQDSPITPDELLAFIADTSQRQALRDAIRQCVKYGTPWHLEVRITTPQNNQVWIMTAGQAEMARGRCLRLFGAVQEINDRVSRENELRVAKNRAESADAAKGEFLASMSHEIRTPMNGIIGMLNIMLGSELEPPTRKQAELALASAESLLALLNDILDFSKIEAGKLEIESVDFDLEKLLTRNTDILRMSAEEKDLTLQLDIRELNVRHVIGDPNRIRQVLTNLIDNAIKFTQRGVIHVRAKTELRDTRVNFVCEVEDPGVGIEQSKQQHIFGTFTQVDVSTTRVFGGSGLGLAIVKRLCQMMGGDIRVDSQLGRGSTFAFNIPLDLGTQADATPTQLSESVPATTPDPATQQTAGGNTPTAETPAHALKPPQQKKPKTAAPPRILLVEDNQVNQMVARTMLQQLNLSCDIAENGRIALELLEAHADGKPYDLVLMDCQMPEMDGYEATSRIREGEAGEAHRAVTIVAMTANAMLGDRERCLAAGMNDYVSKPIEPDRLKQCLTQWLPSIN